MDKQHTTGRLKNAKRAGTMDSNIGNRIRLARTSRELSQEELGRRLGISFQQLQKYELGLNRISASRLLVIAGILDQPITFFFEGWDASPKEEPAARPPRVRRKKGEASRQHVIKVLQLLLAEETADQ